MQPLQRLRLAAFKAQRRLSRCYGQHLQTDFSDQPQRAHAACHEARHVVARHIFHDLATKSQVLALAVDDFYAQHVVTHPAHTGAGRATQPAGNHAANRRGDGVVWRLKWQALAVGGKQCLQLQQGCARPSRDNQLAWLIADDASQCGGLKQFAL